mgnify:CR=1 FL=1
MRHVVPFILSAAALITGAASAQQQLAAFLKRPVSEVVLQSANKQEWGDGSLGCPAPGVQYTQAQVKGMQVVVEAAGRRFDYRFGAGDSPKLCERGGPAASSATR